MGPLYLRIPTSSKIAWFRKGGGGDLLAVMQVSKCFTSIPNAPDMHLVQQALQATFLPQAWDWELFADGIAMSTGGVSAEGRRCIEDMRRELRLRHHARITLRQALLNRHLQPL